MSKEYLKALNKIQHDFGQLKGQELVSCYETIFNALKRLEAIDNANPSEALECLEKLELLTCDFEWYKDNINIIKQAILKAQEPKKYLKWEDLEFRNEEQTMKVKMGDTNYLLTLRIGLTDVKSVVLRDNNLKPFLHLFEKEKQFFNDLHLERVEE